MARKMRGHFNYFGVTDNSRALYRFERAVHATPLQVAQSPEPTAQFHVGAFLAL